MKKPLKTKKQKPAIIQDEKRENNRKTLFFSDIFPLVSEYWQEYMDKQADQLFPTRISMDFLQKMAVEDPKDPLALQVLPSARETLPHPEYTQDPVGDQKAMACPGLLHKYRNRVLLISTPNCAIHCRYCFRRSFAYQNTTSNRKNLKKSIKYIKQHTEIKEVILSGGDPLTLSNQSLFELCQQLANINHITTLRIHSRFPVVNLKRIDQDFLDFFTQLPLKKLWVSHINHPRELDQATADCFQNLANTGFTLLNQSVLLKDINNHPKTLVQLSHALFQQGILPYYLHLLDKVSGASHFFIPDSEAIELHKKIQAELPGYLVPRLVRETAGSPAKTLVYS